MSCDLRKQTLEALRSQCKGNIDKARVNVEIYLHNPVGIGEHPDVLAAIQDQIDVIAKEEEYGEKQQRKCNNDRIRNK